jgi:hypothetical protein
MFPASLRARVHIWHDSCSTHKLKSHHYGRGNRVVAAMDCFVRRACQRLLSSGERRVRLDTIEGCSAGRSTITAARRRC